MGFVRSKDVRFTDFVYKRSWLLGHRLNLATFPATGYVGLSPAGGAMVVAFRTGLAPMVWAELELYTVGEPPRPAGVIPPNVVHRENLTLSVVDGLERADG